jgi:hypothetical protein
MKERHLFSLLSQTERAEALFVETQRLSLAPGLSHEKNQRLSLALGLSHETHNLIAVVWQSVEKKRKRKREKL